MPNAGQEDNDGDTVGDVCDSDDDDDNIPDINVSLLCFSMTPNQYPFSFKHLSLHSGVFSLCL